MSKDSESDVKPTYYGTKENKAGNWVQGVFALLAVLVFVMFVGYVGRGIYNRIYGENTSLLSLVDEIRKDIKKIDDNSETGWKVEEAEVEVNFVVKDSSDTKTDLKAVSNKIGSERENSHRLLLKLRRVTTPNAETKNPSETQAPTTPSARPKTKAKP